MDYCLVYISSSTTLVSADEIEEMIAQSQPRNRGLGITGLLLYLNGSTIHILEGAKQHVKDEFAIIRQDSRHHHVLVMYQSPIPYRLFNDWHLNYKAGHVRQLDQLDEIRATWREDMSNPALSTLRSFYESNYRN